MTDNYTRSANKRCYALIDRNTKPVWQAVQSVSRSAGREVWKSTLDHIAKEQLFTSRFALMRICHNRAALREEESFTEVIDGAEYRFGPVTIDHALDMDIEELEKYEQLLMSKAQMQEDADPEADAILIRRALLNQPRVPLAEKMLSREEAFRLGHILDFSLEEMAWFLLRTFETDAGFRYNASDDLIEAYGFLTGAGWKRVEGLKEQYREAAAGAPKAVVSEKKADWTQSVSLSLPEQIGKWPAETRDQDFIAWLTGMAPLLDLPSRTAMRVYRNLAAFAYMLIAYPEDCTPIETDLADDVGKLVSAPEESEDAVNLLYDGEGNISPGRCKKLAGTLLLENQYYTVSGKADKVQSWHYLKMRNGQLSATGGYEHSRTRVRDILLGTVPCQKSDLLYLLWFIANLCWFWNHTDTSLTQSELYDRLYDFIDLAENCLNEALLPEFYVPQPMEQCLMLSIVCGGVTCTDPCEVYEQICSSLIVPRARRNN